ncbi:MAG: RNA methyltransferase [Deltaproteobacteria bacterium]|nr:RNA methyltransferase [Candidatus Anaeroferrophillacea bacterium]
MKPIERIRPVLVHCPVVDREGQEIVAAVTNLDIHDLARIACTYGTGEVWLVTPVPAQQRLVREIISHWTAGFGAEYNPDRARALARVRCAAGLDDVRAAVAQETGGRVWIAVTTARRRPGACSLAAFAARLAADGGHWLLLFGTAWGLAPRLLGTADAVLEPLAAGSGYNHLPVRAAAAIVIDRLAAG